VPDHQLHQGVGRESTNTKTHASIHVSACSLCKEISLPIMAIQKNLDMKYNSQLGFVGILLLLLTPGANLYKRKSSLFLKGILRKTTHPLMVLHRIRAGARK
jgi:hypothetical protein